jgi:hypothetical protein
MDTHLEGRIYYHEANSLTYEGENYRFADLEEANRMNDARNYLDREGIWPGYHIRIVKLAHSDQELLVVDSELAAKNWRGPRIVSFDEAFLWLALGLMGFLAFIALYYKFNP